MQTVHSNISSKAYAHIKFIIIAASLPSPSSFPRIKQQSSQLLSSSNVQLDSRAFSHPIDLLTLLQRNTLAPRRPRSNLQLLKHNVPRLLDQIINVLLRFPLRHNRLRHPHRNRTGTEQLPPHIQDVAVVCDRDRDDGHLRLHGEVESALFEGEQVRVVVVAARAFGEDVDGLPVLVHLLGGGIEGGDGLGAGFALDEDGFAEGHC